MKIIDEMPAADVVEVDPCKRERQKKYHKKYREERKAFCMENKLCYRCFKRDNRTEEGRTYCADCAQKHTDFTREYQKRKRGLTK